MNIFFCILSISSILAVSFATSDHEPHDVVSLAGDQKTGKVPTVLFINYFGMFPTEPYPHKVDGPTKEVPPDELYLLPDYLTYMIYMILIILSILILFHLLRRRPIDHFAGLGLNEWNYAEELKLEELRKTRKSDHSKLFFYKQWTNHVATSQKLSATFERDFDPALGEMSEEEYAKKRKVTLEQLHLENKPCREIL